jgi:tetratricopeptide (TPR) repeat protein
MQRIRPMVVVLVALSLTGVVYAGGGAKKMTEEKASTETATLTPEQEAIQSYNMGISSRDKAWKLENKMAESDDPAEQEKLGKKVTKSYKSAATAFERAIRSNPMMFEAHSDLGYCLRKQGDYEAALAAYDKALEIQPKYAEAIEYRAEAYLGLNRLDEAKQAYMALFKGQSDQAAALLEAMQRWVVEQEGGADEAFSLWVTERAEIAGQTKSVSQLKDADW